MLCIITTSAVFAIKQEITVDEVTKVKNKSGQKFRIGYVETDPYYNFAGTLHGIILGLQSVGLIEDVSDIPFIIGQSDTTIIWEWLAAKKDTTGIEFVRDAHYSFIDPGAEEDLRKRLEEKDDLDLMIVMGTAPGQKLAQYDHEVPMLVFSSSDAVGSGIIDSVEDSGKNHVWAHVDPGRYQRQLEVFHDLFQFKKIGLIYEDSPNGRIYSAYGTVQVLSQYRGFDIVDYHVDEPTNDPQDIERYHKEMSKGIKALSEQVDAVYLTANQIENERLASMLTPLYEKNIPVFSQIGSNEVEYGALLSLYRANYLGIGRFGAETIKSVMNGANPRDLEQNFGDTPSIVLHLEVANKIGYKPPFEVLLATDKVYRNIKGVIQ